MGRALRIGIVAGELSGDQLGGGLVKELSYRYPDCVIEGIGGATMIAAGCHSLFPLSALSVMGFIDPLKRLPQLLMIRHRLLAYFKKNPPDVFIGIDYPEFNLSVAGALKKRGICTVHYVSPSIWAWREQRIHRIKRSIDLMLTLFPFETAIYERYQVPHVFVGHPLASELCVPTSTLPSKQFLSLDPSVPYVALLPGSRTSEVHALTDVFLQAAALCQQRHPELRFLCPVTQIEHREYIAARQRQLAPAISLTIIDRQAQQVLCAVECALIASGTATLESCLLGCPTVVAYKTGALTYQLLRRLVKIPYIALPNLIMNQQIMPEFIQHEATPEHCAAALEIFMNNPVLRNDWREIAQSLSRQLHKNVHLTAVNAIQELIDGYRCRS